MSVDSTQPYITVTAAGPAGLAELSGVAAFVAEVAKCHARTQVLANLSRVEPTLSFTDHLRFGALAWELLSGVERVAAVVPAAYLDAPAARAAKLAGMPLRTFLRVADAKSWLARGIEADRDQPARVPGGAAPAPGPA